MSRFRSISSRQNELVARFRAAARGDVDSLLLLDGKHLLADAVACGLPLHHAMVSSEGALDENLRPLLDQLFGVGVDVVEASPSVMAAVSPVRTPSAVVALAARPPAVNLFAAASPKVVIACDVQDPGNIGAIARVAEASGAAGLVAAGRSADPFGWKALRGSMGSGLRLPMRIEPLPADAVSEAHRHGCRIVATVPRGGDPLFGADLSGPVAFLIGGEGPGLTQALVQAADLRITIPMNVPVESLNAAIATALVLYEARRGRDLGRRPSRRPATEPSTNE